MNRLGLLLTAFVLLFIVNLAVPQEFTEHQTPQSSPEFTNLSDVKFQQALVDYVYQQYLEYGEWQLPQERFLVALMRLINKEVSRRLVDPKAARQKYFNDLHQMLDEVQSMRNRFRQQGMTDLLNYADELASRIKMTIKMGEINYKKKQIFEDALQLLLVAEESVKLDTQRATQQPLVSREISESKEKLLSAFGEIPPRSEQPVKSVSIYDLFREWREYDQLKFDLRLADVKVARTNLLKNSGLEEIQRMFNDELYLAYSAFNFGNYDLAERLLQDLLETYPHWGVKDFEDLLFYRAESNFALNRLMHARNEYQELLNAYPTTVFLPQVYARLTQIEYELNDFSKAIEYASLYQNIASDDDPRFFDVQFIKAMAAFQLGRYEQTIEALLNLPENYPYYWIGQYFIGNAYAASQRYEDALQVYLKLISEKDVPVDVHSRSLYKAACIEYERQNYFAAIEYLSRVPEDFPNYDKILNALAWSFFEYERKKDSEVKDFSAAKYYAQRLLDEYYASPYQMEATSLLAYIDQLELQNVEAIDLYREVYQTKVKKRSVEEYLSERDRLENLYEEAVAIRNQALQQMKPAVYERAQRIVERLEAEIQSLDLAEASSAGVSVYREINTMLDQLKQLDELRQKADIEGNKKALEKIDSLRIRLTAVLSRFPIEMIERAKSINWFDDFPVSRYVAEEEYRNRKFNNYQQNIHMELQKIDQELNAVYQQIGRAQAAKNYSLVIRLEQKARHLEEMRKRYDELYSLLAFSGGVSTPYPEFNKWGDFGAFGIINVHFDQKKRIQDYTTQLSQALDKVNKLLNERKQSIEDKIKRIEAEIRLMTMKARMEERTRLRAERERAFRETYFDTRTGEIEEK